MPLLNLDARDTCMLCGCRLRGGSVGTFRINKESLKSPRGTLSFAMCPECGPSRRAMPTPCNRWVLTPESLAIVDAHRARKGWPPWMPPEPTTESSESEGAA